MTQAFRSDLLQLFAGFTAQGGNDIVIYILRDQLTLGFFRLTDMRLLPLDVTRILRFDLNLTPRAWVDCFVRIRQKVVAHCRLAKELRERRAIVVGLLQTRQFRGYFTSDTGHFIQHIRTQNTQAPRVGFHAPGRVVLTKRKPMFGPGSKHPVGFLGSLGDQIIDEDADIGFVSAEYKRFFASEFEHGVGARHKSLAGRFLISRGSIDLPGEVQMLNPLGFKGVKKLRRI